MTTANTNTTTPTTPTAALSCRCFISSHSLQQIYLQDAHAIDEGCDELMHMH